MGEIWLDLWNFIFYDYVFGEVKRERSRCRERSREERWKKEVFMVFGLGDILKFG